MKLKDKTYIVTGGSKGIGLAISKKIIDEGGSVICCARNKPDIDLGKDFIFEKLDVSDNYDVLSFMYKIKDKFNVNGLVNCAGVYGAIGKTTDVNLAKFLNTLQINLMGTIYMSTSFVNIFGGNCKIVNFSGGGAASPFPNYSAYSTSKIAIVRFTENLSIELKDENVEVNCVAPGFVATTLHNETLNVGPESAGDDFYKNTVDKMKYGAVPPEKASDLTVFLLSEESNGITGKFISAPWDPWQEKDFQDLLRNDKDFATLRRIDNKQFFKK